MQENLFIFTSPFICANGQGKSKMAIFKLRFIFFFERIPIGENNDEENSPKLVNRMLLLLFVFRRDFSETKKHRQHASI